MVKTKGIKNINFKLIDNKQEWCWINDDDVDDNMLTRLFRALYSATTYNAQEELLSKVTINEGRNSSAICTLQFNCNDRNVMVQECKYVKNENKYKRGKNIGVIKI